MSLRWVQYRCNPCEMKVFSGQPSLAYFISISRIESFQVSSLNCSKRSLLTGRFEITKCTWWIRLFSSNSGLQFLMYAQMRATKTNIVFPGEYFKSNSYFCKHRKNLWIWGRQLTMDLLKIDFNGWWSFIAVNIDPEISMESLNTKNYRKGFCMRNWVTWTLAYEMNEFWLNEMTDMKVTRQIWNTGKHLCWSLFLIKRLQHSFFIEHPGSLLLKSMSILYRC